MGENRYLALPAKETSPPALENSSGVRRSVIVALKEGSKRAENVELTNTPMQMQARVASPLSMLMSMNMMPSAEHPSPIIIIRRLSNLSAKTPAGTLKRTVGRNPSSVTSAMPAALPVLLNI